MVTFSLPGDGELADAAKSTPRPRPPLPFAKRAYVSTPYNSKRLGTPQTSSARKLLTTRDEIPTSSLNKSQIATARNIFRSSSISDAPPVAPFSPALPQDAMKKVFAPGATPEPTRVFRASTAQATPRGMAARATSKDLFKMRIADPDPELSGEALTRKIPQEWNTKASIYADQYLAHLCPPEFDEEQRRQFFCILDLRRLKYAANEIFANKDWKLNVINFAKEFEKSRSIILLRYGLYEFQNVKPSKEVLKRWRREHGLPEPEDEAEDAEPTPTKTSSEKKRKAEDDVMSDAPAASASANTNKRHATDRNGDFDTPVATPSLNKNKRKTEEPESQPNKLQKSTPSASKALFEKITNNSSTTPAGSPTKFATKPSEGSTSMKPNPFTASKANGSLSRSVFENMKQPSAAQGAAGGSNIFGYLSDASSAKNSGVEADAESESDSDEPEESQEAEKSDEPSTTASGAETASQAGSSLFAHKPAFPSGLATGSAPGTRESTPGRSLFDRVTKNSDGQPVRAEEKVESTPFPAAAADQTWNPTTTPIKFGPPASTTQASSLFGNNTNSASKPSFGLGNNTSTPGATFTPKAATTSNLFAAKPAEPVEKISSKPATEEIDAGDESDKENESAPKKPSFESKTSEAQLSFGTSSLFQPKAAAEPTKDPQPTKPSTLFGAPSKSDDKPASTASSIFGAKPAETPKPVMQSSTLFGNKASESDKPAATVAPQTGSLFGAGSTTTPAAEPTKPSLFGASTSNASSLFGGASASTGSTSNIFGGASSTPAKSLFGASTVGENAAPKPDAAPSATQSTPAFSFGGDKPSGVSLFGAGPKSPTSAAPANNMFGSPMKQDESPAKKPFTGASKDTTAPPPIFGGFAAGGQSAPTSNLFGGASGPANGASTAAPAFGAAPASGSGSASGSFNFSFGGGAGGTSSAGSSFNNPFSSGTSTSGDNAAAPSTSGGMFNFGATTAPATNGSTPFQFGGSSTPSAAAPVFGANTSSAPAFGASTSSSEPPKFGFSAASPAPQQNATFQFGATPQNGPAFLQPPAGGASTTGTSKSPFPHRKIRPLKRRV